jgi:pimeloyl-ACP methyl ester carboxylesterase
MQLLHGRVPIELHTLKPASGQPLLLLHALGASVDAWPAEALGWSHGPVYGIDFAGHGKSGRVRGGAYYPEYFLADADLALEQIGEPCVLAGAGVGAYVALLLAGARADQIPGALLLEGAGLEGGGAVPDHDHGRGFDAEDIEGFENFVAAASDGYVTGTDPLVAQCERDIRPVDYVTSYAQSAKPLLFSSRVGREFPAPIWWQTAVEANRGVAAPAEFVDAIALLASMASTPA